MRVSPLLRPSAPGHLLAAAALVAASWAQAAAAARPLAELRVQAEVSDLQLVDGPQRANVDVTVAGRAERSVAVTLKLSLRAQQWCARTPVASGQVLQPSAFDGCLVAVRHPVQLDTAGAPLPTG